MWPVKFFTIVWKDDNDQIHVSYHCYGMHDADAASRIRNAKEILAISSEN